jgi:hypothetical protein
LRKLAVRISTVRKRCAAGWAYGLLGMLAFAVSNLGEQLPRFPDQVSTLQCLFLYRYPGLGNVPAGFREPRQRTKLGSNNC